MRKVWETGIKDGYETKIVQVGNCTVRIHSPILDKDERIRREEQVKDALIQFGRRANHEEVHRMAAGSADQQVQQGC